MFREMRRSGQALSSVEVEAVLSRNTNGIMGVIGDGGYPYTVPLSYVYHDGKIYFHTAKSGHKIDAILNNNKVSFTVVDKDTIVSEEYTTYFRSVIAFGTAAVVEDEAERLAAFDKLVEKYSQDQPVENRLKEVRGCDRSHIVGINIEHVTGKEALELAKKKKTV